MWACLACACGCSRKPRAIGLATTTSTENSGLLEAILPAFTERHGIRVDVIAVGTGRAFVLARNGDVDAVLVHAPGREREFVDAGFGVNRREVCRNDFVILGPPGDPAGIRGVKNAAAALARIAAAREFFVSRGDGSGTHVKEAQLWSDAGVEPGGGWYVAAGQGMGACLTIAHEKQAYVLSDRGTYLAFKGRVDLQVLVEGDERLLNPYGVIAVNPELHPHVRYAEAEKLIEWLVSAEAQEMIADFTVGGERLFHPSTLEE